MNSIPNKRSIGIKKNSIKDLSKEMNSIFAFPLKLAINWP
jgi:hypothetical protein